MDRREFCISLAALAGTLSTPALRASGSLPAKPCAVRLDRSKPSRFGLEDVLEHPFYWWPRTLLRYPIESDEAIDPSRWDLRSAETGEAVPFQFSGDTRAADGSHRATLKFFSDLPSGGRREFILSAAATPVRHAPQVKEHRDGDTIVLDSGAVRVRIPASRKVRGDAPGPVLQMSRGGPWRGTSTLRIDGDRILRIVARRVESGPLSIAYELAYESAKGARYVACVRCEAGSEFIRFQEDMEGLPIGVRGEVLMDWTDLGVTHRQAPNHPFPLSDEVRPYEEYPWEGIDERWKLEKVPLPAGQLPFSLGIYERAPGNFRTGTWANFWNEKSGDAIGVFIDDVAGWCDHEYACEVVSPTLLVRYHRLAGRFVWKWPLARGRRSTCLAFYDHDLDKQAMARLERDFQKVPYEGATYAVPLTFTSHALFLQNRHGSLDLDRMKDWVLTYPKEAPQAGPMLEVGRSQDPAELERRVMTSAYACTLAVSGTRQMAGHGPIPGRSIVNFSPVPSRQIPGWVDGFNLAVGDLTDRQRRRLTAMFLLLAHVHAGDEFMPVVGMLAGHPNFLADVKSVPPSMACLFPAHPMASTWADHWEKCVELNTRFHTRPPVKAWDALGGRWTENLGTYVWAFLGPTLRTSFLLKQRDGHERLASPQVARLADWLVSALSAPFDGESPEGYGNLKAVDQGREWGVVPPGGGPARVHPPQGAHSEQRIPPRELWHLGQCLRRYAPLAAEHAMWAARPTSNDMEGAPDRRGPWDVIYRLPENRGTDPHLRSAKHTGHGVVLRAAVGTRDELSVHLQQIDSGPNYRWGRAGEGGCGILYFYAGGRSYSYTAPEDVGDRDDEDTEFCTNFGVYKSGRFHSIGMNVLSRPLYDLGTAQFAEIVPRTGPGSYSAPEFLGRSVLLAGHEYFVLYDSVAHQALTHRLTWFVRKGDKLPELQLLRGAVGNRETQWTELSTASSTGMWFDGLGDSLAVVSHRKDVRAEVAPFGCRVHLPGAEDLVFRDSEPVRFDAEGCVFDGTAGLVRKTAGAVRFALFHGTRIGVPGFIVTTEDTDLGFSGIIVPGDVPSGEYFAPKASSVRILAPGLPEKGVFYVDGEARTARRASGVLMVDLPSGRHHWELTGSLPVPCAPVIVRTEDVAGGGRVVIGPVASATRYRLGLSRDGGASWTEVLTGTIDQLSVTDLQDGEKVHVRVTALNDEHASEPGPGYPLYVSKEAPAAPDGLRVALSEGAAALSWGEILGASGYRLYVRHRSEKGATLLYQGTERSYLDRRAGIRGPAGVPSSTPVVGEPPLVEYWVTALNGNGESPRSRVADTDPASWRNWDPTPGERFRRVTRFEQGSQPSPGEEPRYYPD